MRINLPALVILDIKMPGIDSYTACHTIKQDPATRTMPVVMLTAIGQELNKKLANEMGASGYVTKPFSLQDLLDAIDRFLTGQK